MVDAQKGKTFSRLLREVAVAARQGGANPEANFRLKTAMEKARAANIPNDNIQRAVQRAASGSEGANLEEILYEGYGPGGAAILLEILTDNRNRTAGDIRHLFTKHGGNLGESGCVAWMFERRGVLRLSASPGPDEDELTMAALEAGADDLEREDDAWLVYTPAEELEQVRRKLEAAGIPSQEADFTYVPRSTVRVAGEEAQRLLRLVEALEDHDDVQALHSNFDIPEEELAQFPG